MPTTLAGGMVSISMLVAINYDLVMVLEQLPVLAAVCGLAMVSSLPLPKVVRRSTTLLNVFQITNVALAYVFGLSRNYPEYLWVLMAGYTIIGFAWGFVHRAELAEQRRAALAT